MSPENSTKNTDRQRILANIAKQLDLVEQEGLVDDGVLVRASVASATREKVIGLLEIVPQFLLMDDRKPLTSGLQRNLRRLAKADEGAIIVENDPKEGERRLADLDHYSVVISDNDMKVPGFSGVEVAMRNQENSRARGYTYTIFSGDNPSTFNEALQAGAIDHFFPKPAIREEDWAAIASTFASKVSNKTADEE